MASGLIRLPSDELVKQFCDLLRAGNYVQTACEFTGIPERSVYQWLQEGQREDGREWTQQFTQAVKEARAHAQAANLQIVQRAAHNGTWQAAAWFLERSRPNQWALRDRREIETLASEDGMSSRERLSSALDALSDAIYEEEVTSDVIELPGAVGETAEGQEGAGA